MGEAFTDPANPTWERKNPQDKQTKHWGGGHVNSLWPTCVHGVTAMINGRFVAACPRVPGPRNKAS